MAQLAGRHAATVEVEASTPSGSTQLFEGTSFLFEVPSAVDASTAYASGVTTTERANSGSADPELSPSVTVTPWA